MTTDEIRSCDPSDDRLRIFIAEALGWTEVRCRTGTFSGWTPKDQLEYIPYWPTDPAAAMELLVEADKRNWHVNLQTITWGVWECEMCVNIHTVPETVICEGRIAECVAKAFALASLAEKNK